MGASPAAAANSGSGSGSVTCINNTTVVGVWVNASGGTSGYASRSGSGWQNSWSFDTQGKPYSLTVGCGGSTQNWASSTSTATYRTNWTDILCWVAGGRYGGASGAVSGRCT